MGLHDGASGASDAGSTAQIAKWLRAPVVLVVDARFLARSAAAMVHGFRTFDEDVRVEGVVMNRVAGDAHAEWLREAVGSAKSIRDVVVWILPPHRVLAVRERLLGLVPPRRGVEGGKDGEGFGGSGGLDVLERLFSEHIDLGALRAIASTAGLPRTEALPHLVAHSNASIALLPPVRIAVARDAAFCFVYEDNLKMLEAAGATLLFFSPLVDAELPQDVHALYLIGGYPEWYAERLQHNVAMRSSVKAFCERGGFVWAECGGLMYLAQFLHRRPVDATAAAEAGEDAMVVRSKESGGDCGRSLSSANTDPRAGTSSVGSELVHEMCGVLPFDVTMTARMSMGYCIAALREQTAVFLRLPPGATFRCQQYHFSEATVNGEPAIMVNPATGGGAGIATVETRDHAFDVEMQVPGSSSAPEGAHLHGGTVATYCHFHFGADTRLATAIVGAARRTQLIVSLLPSGTEIVALLLGEKEASSRLIGVSEYCDWPEKLVRNLPVVSRTALPLEKGMSGAEVDMKVKKAKNAGLQSAHVLDVAWLASRRPGIVLTQDTCRSCDAAQGPVLEALQAARISSKCALTLKPTTVSEMLSSVKAVGLALGETEQAVGLVVDVLSERLSGIAKAVAVAKRPRILGVESLCPLVASGQWLPDMRLRAGGIDALGGVPGCPPRVVSWETVETSEADVMVITCCGRSAAEAAAEVEEHLLTRPGIWELPALRAQPQPRLFVCSHECFSRPGPRLVDGVETLAALLHPKLLESDLVSQAVCGVLRLVVCEDWNRDDFCSGPPASWRFVSLSNETPESSLTLRPAAEVKPSVVQKTMDLATPPVRCAASIVRSDDGALILFGGDCSPNVQRAARGMGDVWGLSAPKGGKWMPSSSPEPRWEGPWKCGATANEGVPTPRSNHAAIAAGDHMLIFGGWSADGNTPLSEPELLHLRSACWTHCSTRNSPPPPRGNPTIVYSPRRHLVIVYGGWDRVTRFNDVWCLDMESWIWHHSAAAVESVSVRPRTDHAAVLWQASSASEHMIIFGGSTSDGASDELLVLDCSSGSPDAWRWSNETAGFQDGSTSRSEVWPAPRTSHAMAIVGEGPSASLVLVGGQDGSLGTGAASIIADAWILAPLGSPSRRWTRIDCWHSVYPLQRCRHSLVAVDDDLVIVYGGYDGARTLDAHHSLFCAPIPKIAVAVESQCLDATEATAVQKDKVSSRRRQQERWEAERPVSEADLGQNDRDRAARSTLPLAMAKTLHRHALQCEPPRDTYIDPDSGYSVFTMAYLKRRPCCGNACRVSFISSFHICVVLRLSLTFFFFSSSLSALPLGAC